MGMIFFQIQTFGFIQNQNWFEIFSNRLELSGNGSIQTVLLFPIFTLLLGLIRFPCCFELLAEYHLFNLELQLQVRNFCYYCCYQFGFAIISWISLFLYLQRLFIVFFFFFFKFGRIRLFTSRISWFDENAIS